uniref:Solute carrier family 25 member 26 n=1 Tax=Macrostomum lignano TaxID=282301 RepID=A0A1I8IAL8_9PLAT
SSAGFWSSGGLRGLFQGVSVVSLLSMPGAAVFFVTYDTGKRRRLPVPVAACLGEAAACLVRVPCEVVKQRAQTDRLGRRPYRIFADCLREEGPAGLYRGFRSTIIRELPFASLQFPLWEALKALAGPGWADKPATSAASGHDRLASGSVLAALSTVHSERGLPGLFAGAAPRTAMIAIAAPCFLASTTP